MPIEWNSEWGMYGWEVPVSARVDREWLRRVNDAVVHVHQHAPGEDVILIRGNPRVTTVMMLTLSDHPVVVDPRGVTIHLKEDKSLSDYEVWVEVREPSGLDTQRVVHDAPNLTDLQVEVFAKLRKDGAERSKALEMASLIR